MTATALSDIESRLGELSRTEQLALLERLARQVRRETRHELLQSELAAMATDPEIQRENVLINADLGCATGDGLKPEREIWW